MQIHPALFDIIKMACWLTGRLQQIYLWVIVALICGRVSTEKVIISLVVHIPDKHTLSLVQHDRNGRIVVGTVLVLSLNKL